MTPVKSCSRKKRIYNGNKSHFYFLIFMPILQFYYLMTYGTEQVQYVQNQTNRQMKQN